MSKIYKRHGSPYWQYTNGDGPYRIQKSTKTKDRRIAVKIQNQWDQDYALQQAGYAVPTIGLEEIAFKYFKVIEENKQPKYASCVKSTINVFLNKHPNITNKHLTAFLFQEYFSFRQSDGKSPKTIREDHKILHNWCTWMIAMGYLNDDPTAGLIKPKLVKVRPRHPFTRLEVETAFKQANSIDRVFWNVLYKTGLRAVDACTLSIDNIKGKYLEVSQNKTQNYNNSRTVIVPLHNDLQSMDIFNIMNPNSIGNSRKRLQAILGHGDLHTFRHTFATHLEELGATRWETKCLLGHKANDVTAQYVKVNINHLSHLINQL